MASNEELAEICRGWGPTSLVTYYNWRFAAAGQPHIRFPDHMYPVVLGLCDTRIKKLMLQIGPGSGKSVLLSTVYPEWLLGHDPAHTILGVSGAEDLSQGFMAACMDSIANSIAFKCSFPGVKPDKQKGWSNAAGMYVTGHKTGNPDASFWACGLASKALTGKHARTIVIDDPHDATNSATAEQCANVVRIYTTQLLGRADPIGARFLLAGRRWSTSDLYGLLQYDESWVVLVLPAERPNSEKLFYDVFVPDKLECVFTDGVCFLGDGDVSMVATDVPHAVPVIRKTNR